MNDSASLHTNSLHYQIHPLSWVNPGLVLRTLGNVSANVLCRIDKSRNLTAAQVRMLPVNDNMVAPIKPVRG